MKTQSSCLLPLTGQQRYLLLDAVNKRIATLAFRDIQRAQNGEPERADLKVLAQEFKDLRDHLQAPHAALPQ